MTSDVYARPIRLVALTIAMGMTWTLASAEPAANTKPSGASQAAPTSSKPKAEVSGAPAVALPLRQRTALKIAGLVTFVANSCPQLKPDYARFGAALGALGVSEQDLAKPDMKVGYLGYTAEYEKDVKANCERARLQFGPKGATVPDLFGLR